MSLGTREAGHLSVTVVNVVSVGERRAASSLLFFLSTRVLDAGWRFFLCVCFIAYVRVRIANIRVLDGDSSYFYFFPAVGQVLLLQRFQKNPIFLAPSSKSESHSDDISDFLR